MNDADIQTLIKSVLDTAIDAGPFLATVAQSYQPTQQGAPLETVVVFTQISVPRFGSPRRTYVYNVGTDDFTNTQSQYVRATYQFSVMGRQDATDPASRTASDVANFCAMVLQSDATIATFKASGVGVHRVSEVRTPSTPGDGDRFQMDVNFDLVLTYQITLASTVPTAAVTGRVEAV